MATQALHLGRSRSFHRLRGRHRHWSALPKSAVWEYFSRWEWEGTTERIHLALYSAVREPAGPEARLTTAIVDSQMAKSA